MVAPQAEHVQDEAAERFRTWRTRREPRIPKPPGPVCRASFAAALRLTDPTVDPKSFFRLACVLEPAEDMILKDQGRTGGGTIVPRLPRDETSGSFG
eukprot:Skav222580  [mRNA]  locus=scaffold1897:96696:99545:- [translate_table: standard]